MRTIIFAAGLVVAATPVFAYSQQGQKAWEDDIKAQSQVFVSVAPCGSVGFKTDQARAETRLKAVFSSASSRGVALSYADSYASMQLTAAMTQMKVHYSVPASDDPATGYRWMNDQFSYWTPICTGMAGGGNGIEPGAFQKSARPATYIDYLEHKAEQGLPYEMVLVASMYGLRLAPDPGGVNELKWLNLAVNKRSGEAAYRLALLNADGASDQPKNAAQGMVWLLISEELGREDELALKPELQKALTKAELAKARADATAWLANH